MAEASQDPVEEAKPNSDKEKKTVSNESGAAENRQQKYLSANIDKVYQYYLANQDLFAYRAFRQVNGNGAHMVNKLRGITGIDTFYNMKTSVLSLLQPKLRIYKVTYEETIPLPGGPPGTGTRSPLLAPCYREFVFSDNFGTETAASVEDYLAYEGTKPSWRNIGLEGFSFEQIGTSHGAEEDNIECTLKLSFKSLKDLAAQPPGEPPPEKGGLRYVDLILFPEAKIDRNTQQYNPKHYQIKVLMGYTAPSLDQLKAVSPADLRAISNLEKLNIVLSLVLYNHDFSIKEDGSVELTANFRGVIESTLNSNQVNIFQDTFKIEDSSGNFIFSGEAEIRNNTARLSRLMTVLKSAYKKLRAKNQDDQCEARSILKKMIEEDSVFSTVYRDARDPEMRCTTGRDANGDDVGVRVKNGIVSVTDPVLIGDWLKTEPEEEGASSGYDKMVATMRKKVGFFKRQVYQSFLRGLIEGNPVEAGGSGTRLFCARISKDEIRKQDGIVLERSATNRDQQKDASEEDVQTDAIKKAFDEASATNTKFSGFSVGRCNDIKKATAETMALIAKEIEDDIKSESDSKDSDAEGEEKDKAKETVVEDATDSYMYQFIFLGDVIELACKNAGLYALDYQGEDANKPYVFDKKGYILGKETELDYPLTHMRMLLGPVEYYGADGDLKRINLAQFPLSFDAFREWFFEKIISRGRVQMPLGTFITKLLNELVLDAMGAGMLKSIKPRGTRTQAVALTLPGQQIPGQDIIAHGRYVPRVKELLPHRPVIDVDSADFDVDYFQKVSNPVSSESMLKSSFDYWFVHISTNKGVATRAADPREDLNEGIYHFNIGSDMGLLKKMDFKKMDFPGMAELRSLEAIENGSDQMQQLAFPYNCDLTLVGTPLFTPGMFFYANPSFLGLGAPEDANSLAYQLNLGGYFLILTTKMSINKGMFETKVSGVTVGHGRKRLRADVRADC